MSLLRDPAETVLTLGVPRAAHDAVRAALCEGPVSTVVHLGDDDRLVRAVRERDDVGCVVVGDDDDIDPESVCERLRDDAMPVVGYVRDGDERTAHRLTAAGATTYVPHSVGLDRLRDCVEAAVAAYERRRERDAESSMFRSLLERADVPIYAKDTDARIVRMSVVSAGYDPEALRGKTDLEIFEEDVETAREAYADDRRVIEEGAEIHRKEERFDFPEGPSWSETTKVPWYDHDDVLRGLVGISWDVTEYARQRQRLEAQRRRFETFADYVTHDLRTPLQVASGHLEIARDTGDEESLEAVADALNRIEEMLSDFSTLAAEESPTAPGEGRWADEGCLHARPIAEVARSVWDVVGTETATFECRFDPDAVIHAPDSSLRPIFENCFANAVRHAGPDVTVAVGPLARGGFYVADDGPGIPESERSRIFEKGYTTADDGEGTGLTLVEEIADRRGWSVDATESRWGGACIEVGNCLLVNDPDRDPEPGEAVSLSTTAHVGATTAPESVDYDPDRDRWTVVGSGRNIWKWTNDFYYVFAHADGPVRIEGRIADLESVGEYSKAGVMVRASTDESAPYAHVGLTPEHGTEFLYRQRADEFGRSQFLGDETGDHRWVRLDAVDGTVTAAVSADGETFHPIAQRRVELDSEFLVGLAVCSFRPRRNCEVVFEDVSVRRLRTE